MRDLRELNIQPLYGQVNVPPTESSIAEFERTYALQLPEDYLAFLRLFNGGHPELDTVLLDEIEVGAGWAVNHFFSLDEEKAPYISLWWGIEMHRPTLGPSALPFAEDGGSNVFFLDVTESPAPVMISVWDRRFDPYVIMPTFEAFIDALQIDPDAM